VAVAPYRSTKKSTDARAATQGTAEVSSNIGSITAAAEQTGTVAGQVLLSAGELQKNGATLKTQVDEFLRTVRSLLLQRFR
jgi:methyl-accepting chemotaxis protein